MSKAKHTPAPWKLDERGNLKEAFIEAIGDGDLTRLDVSVATDDRCRKTALANARIIAAAPDLLAACELAIEFLRGKCSLAAMPIRDALRSAIGKATFGE